jgi:hypothetical protein
MAYNDDTDTPYLAVSVRQTELSRLRNELSRDSEDANTNPQYLNPLDDLAASGVDLTV